MNKSTTIAKNLLLGHVCSNCAHQYENIDTTGKIDTDKVYQSPYCNKYTGANTCTEWSDMFQILQK